jgi:hypothetical protein
MAACANCGADISEFSFEKCCDENCAIAYGMKCGARLERERIVEVLREPFCDNKNCKCSIFLSQAIDRINAVAAKKGDSE